MKSKICTKCNIDKIVTEYSKDKSLPSGRRADCKECVTAMRRDYARTKDGFITRLYGTQRGNSKRRGHSLPTYSKSDLKDWLYAQERFHHLFHLWEASNYDKMLVPSIDRLDDYEPYSFSNIQLMTWQENYNKLAIDTKAKKHNKSRKEVIQLTMDGEFINVFDSVSDAATSVNVDISNISNVLGGKYKSSGGFKWKLKADTDG